MRNCREVNNDILKDWINFREEEFLCNLNTEDRKHVIEFDKICERILNNVSGHDIEYVKQQLEQLDQNYADYVVYWNEKYYRNGFADAIELLKI